MPLTIVMYHYVREAGGVPARTPAELERELDHVAERYTTVRLQDLGGGDWPDNACLLTFDDGLVEHLSTVAPALERRGLTGVFCPPGRAVLERKPLDVQKTQFLLASSNDHEALGERILEHVGDAGRFRAENTPRHRFDSPATVFVKRALQDGLPEPTRRRVLDELFAEIVGVDERSFADGLYLTAEDCRELVARGHEVVGHGWEHKRLGLLDEAEQRRELERTRTFVDEVGGSWSLCYPYGSRDATTLRLLRELDCRIGLTTDPRRATHQDGLLELPRIDTNDFQREAVDRTPSRGKLYGRS